MPTSPSFSPLLSAHHSSTFPEYLPWSSTSILPAAPEWSGLSWFPPKEQVVYVGADSRKHSEEGMGVEGGKPWRLNQRAGHNGAQPLLGTLWGGIRMCLVCPSAGSWVFIYSPHPSLVERCSWVVHPLAAHIRLPCPWLGQAPRHWRTPTWRGRGKQGLRGERSLHWDHPAQVRVSPELVQGS